VTSPAAGACIEEDELVARVAGGLDASRRLAIDAHVASCESCRIVLSELARTEGSRPIPTALGRYELREQVGAGGMGTVYAAWDPKLGREVAVKILHDAKVDATERFVHERQILAGLEHPNIGRLLDAGETDDQRPFFVMELVDGLPIDQYCDEHRLTTRQRLALFGQVCAAVQHAHQNLVVHRDLKPSNILVTKEGVPKLLDFGIAKLLQDSANLTQTGTGPMTPAFASPEQVRRLPIATASDVYSLGVVLYELLCGVSPYGLASRKIDELLEAICNGEPPLPSVAAASIPEEEVKLREPTRERLRKELEGDVDSIVSMALRKEPKARYPSPEALAKDVRSYLAGYPTTARTSTSAYLASKFVRRHKTSIAALVAAFIALTAGLIATAWQARAASRGLERAERRFAQVRSLANSVLFEYHDGIASLPGSTPLRERLVKDALSYLDSLAAEARDDPSLQRELATAYLKVGDVQGDPAASSLGDTTSATSSYLRARAIAEAVLTTDPADPEARKLVASSHGKVGAILEVSGDLNGALAQYEKARAIYEHLALERPEDLEVRFDGSKIEIALGQVYARLGKLEDAVRYLSRALAAREALVTARPDATTHRGLAIAHTALADVFKEQRRAKSAKAHYEKTEAILEEMRAADENGAQTRRMLGVIWLRHADLLLAEGELERSTQLAQKALEIHEALLAADPRNAVARRDLTVALYGLAEAHHATKSDNDARTTGRRGLELSRVLAKDDPSNAQVRRDFGQLSLLVAQIELDLGDLPAARKCYRDLLEVATALIALDPSSELDKELISEGHAGNAQVQLAHGRIDDALATNSQALQALEPIARANPTSGRLQAMLARLEQVQGGIHAARAGAVRERALQVESWRLARDFNQRAVNRFEALVSQGNLLRTSEALHAEAVAGLKQATQALALAERP
jgi:serine/threonine protein kinase